MMFFGTSLVPLLAKTLLPSRGPPLRISSIKESSKGGISVSSTSGSKFGLFIEGGAISDPIIKVDSGVKTKGTTKIQKGIMSVSNVN